MKTTLNNIVFYLHTCSTNKKIMAQLDLEGWNFREIKKGPVTEQDLGEMYKLAGSYEALFSKKSTQIKQLGINLKELGEDDYRRLILQHYSFLKRPIFIADNRIFAGNEKATVAELESLFGKKDRHSQVRIT